MHFQWVFISISSLFGGASPAICGFGAAICFDCFWFLWTALGVLDQSTAMTDAVAMATLINTIANFSTFIGFIKDVKLILVCYMGVISGASSVIGVMILNAYGTHVWYKRALGGMFFLVLCLQLLKKPDKLRDFNTVTIPHLIALGVTCCISGILQGLAGVGGPPFIIFVLLFNYDKKSFIGTYVGNTVIRCIACMFFLFQAGNYHMALISNYASVVVFAILGSIIGLGVSKHVDQKTFRRVLQAVLLLASVSVGSTGTGYTLLALGCAFGFLVILVLINSYLDGDWSSIFGSKSKNKLVSAPVSSYGAMDENTAA